MKTHITQTRNGSLHGYTQRNPWGLTLIQAYKYPAVRPPLDVQVQVEYNRSSFKVVGGRNV